MGVLAARNAVALRGQAPLRSRHLTADYPAVTYDFDLVVIGSGPASQKAAIRAPNISTAVVVIERDRVVGGVCVNTGTIPSKTIYARQYCISRVHGHRGIYHHVHRVKNPITSGDLLWRVDGVIQREGNIIRRRLHRNGVTVVGGSAFWIAARCR